MRRLLIALVAFAALGAGGSFAVRRWLVGQARAHAAQAAADVRTCLLGTGLAPGERPSARMRAIALTVSVGDDWPERCVEHARELDDAIDSRWLEPAVGLDEPAQAALEAEPASRGARIDALFAALARGDLPYEAARVAAAPSPSKPLFAARPDPLLDAVPALGGLALDTVGVDRLRVLLAAEHKLCSFAPPLLEANCRELAPELPLDAQARLARAAPEAPDLVLTGDGLYDVATAQRVFRPTAVAEVQAAVRADGLVALVDAEPKEERDVDGPARLRLVRFAPGKPASGRHVPMSDALGSWLDDEGLVWWRPEDGRAFVQALNASERSPAGSVPRGARARGACELLGRRVLLVAGESAALVVRGRTGAASFPVAATGGPEDMSLACSADAAFVTVRHAASVAALRCTVDAGCGPLVPALTLPEDADAVAVGSFAGRLVAAYARHGLGLRVRIGAAEELATSREQVVVDEATYGGIDVEALRLVTVGDAAVLLVRDRAERLFAFRIDTRGVRPFKLLRTRAARG